MKGQRESHKLQSVRSQPENLPIVHVGPACLCHATQCSWQGCKQGNACQHGVRLGQQHVGPGRERTQTPLPVVKRV